MADVDLKLDGLNNFLKAIKAPGPIAKIGILGNNTRNDGESNATIGAAHEFGTSRVPVRSFLRVPISERLDKELQSSGAFTKEALAKVIKEKSTKQWVTNCAIVAQKIVLEAFDTQGFGKWPANTPETMARKKVKQILTETQQLRNSIEWEVKDAQ